MPADFPQVHSLCISEGRAGTDAGRPGLPHSLEVFL